MNGSYNSLCKTACGKKVRERMQEAGAGRPAAVSVYAVEVPGMMAE